MNRKKLTWLLPVLALVLASLACNAVMGGGNSNRNNGNEFEATVPAYEEPAPSDEQPLDPVEPTLEIETEEVEETGEVGEETEAPLVTEAPAGEAEPTESIVQTDFPLPPNVQNLMEIGENTINFQTAMTLADALAFYRDAFKQQGLTERELLTVVSESTFSLVFDGSPNGQALVVQGVALDGTTTNINIRYEDL